MLFFLLFGLAAAHLEYDVMDRPCEREWAAEKVIVPPPRRIIVARPRVVVPRPCAPRILEHHAPRYNVETKVAAPVYILPKHGPVVDKRPVFASPRVLLRERPVVVRPARIIVRQPTVYRRVPVIIRPRPAIVKPCFDEYGREKLWIKK